MISSQVGAFCFLLLQFSCEFELREKGGFERRRRRKEKKRSIFFSADEDGCQQAAAKEESFCFCRARLLSVLFFFCSLRNKKRGRFRPSSAPLRGCTARRAACGAAPLWKKFSRSTHSRSSSPPTKNTHTRSLSPSPPSLTLVAFVCARTPSHSKTRYGEDARVLKSESEEIWSGILFLLLKEEVETERKKKGKKRGKVVIESPVFPSFISLVTPFSLPFLSLFSLFLSLSLARVAVHSFKTHHYSEHRAHAHGEPQPAVSRPAAAPTVAVVVTVVISSVVAFAAFAAFAASVPSASSASRDPSDPREPVARRRRPHAARFEPDGGHGGGGGGLPDRVAGADERRRTSQIPSCRRRRCRRRRQRGV